MNKKVYIYSGILAALASLICLYFDYRISTGIVIGLLSSYLYFYILNMQFKIEDGKMNKGGVLGYFIRIAVIALPLLLACLMPQYFNIFGAFGGVMLFRVVMMVMFILQKGDM